MTSCAEGLRLKKEFKLWEEASQLPEWEMAWFTAQALTTKARARWQAHRDGCASCKEDK